MGFEVLMMQNIKIFVFLIMTLCSFIWGYQWVRTTCCLHFLCISTKIFVPTNKIYGILIHTIRNLNIQIILNLLPRFHDWLALGFHYHCLPKALVVHIWQSTHNVTQQDVIKWSHITTWKERDLLNSYHQAWCPLAMIMWSKCQPLENYFVHEHICFLKTQYLPLWKCDVMTCQILLQFHSHTPPSILK